MDIKKVMETIEYQEIHGGDAGYDLILLGGTEEYGDDYNFLNELFSLDLSVEDLKYVINKELDFFFEREIYIYNSLKELGKDNRDNGCRDKNEDDEEFAEFLCTTEKFWKLPSGKIMAL